MKDYFSLAVKNLKHRGVRSWLTLLGIFIGIMAVVSLISLGTALKVAVSSQFGVRSTEVITIQAGGVSGYGAPGSGAVDDLTNDDVEAINKLPSIDIAIGRIIGTNRLEFNDVMQIGYTLSVPDGDGRKFAYDGIDIDIYSGRFLQDGDTNKVMIGWNLYNDKEIFGKIVKTGNKIIINDKSFTVVGIVEKKGSLIFDNVVYVNEDSLRDLIDDEDGVDIILAKVKDKDLMDKAKEEIEKLMRKRRDVEVGEEDFEVSTPESQLKTVNSILKGVQIFIIIVAGISIFIGVLGIVNTMTTSVLERKKEIGTMKAVGAKNSQIFFQFFIEAGLLGLVGGLAGALVGSMVGLGGIFIINSQFGAEIALNVDLYLISFTLLGSFFVGAIAGIVPAMRAANQNPVEALKG